MRTCHIIPYIRTEKSSGPGASQLECCGSVRVCQPTLSSDYFQVKACVNLRKKIKITSTPLNPSTPKMSSFVAVRGGWLGDGGLRGRMLTTAPVLVFQILIGPSCDALTTSFESGEIATECTRLSWADSV